ncbi:MAG: DUF4920 domain-containing protein [Thermoanaerobaculia bacterium]
MKIRLRLGLVLLTGLGATPLHGVMPVKVAPGVQRFGKPLTAESTATAVTIAQLVAAPDTYAGKTIRTEGRVATVCTQKGCWMTLGESGKPIRVTFENYGFFVPKNSAGTMATLEGVFKVQSLPEATAKHYAGETQGGKPEAIRGAQQELSIVASGVELAAAAKTVIAK